MKSSRIIAAGAISLAIFGGTLASAGTASATPVGNTIDGYVAAPQGTPTTFFTAKGYDSELSAAVSCGIWARDFQKQGYHIDWTAVYSENDVWNCEIAYHR